MFFNIIKKALLIGGTTLCALAANTLAAQSATSMATNALEDATISVPNSQVMSHLNSGTPMQQAEADTQMGEDIRADMVGLA